jgi:hypothetical protein
MYSISAPVAGTTPAFQVIWETISQSNYSLNIQSASIMITLEVLLSTKSDTVLLDNQPHNSEQMHNISETFPTTSCMFHIVLTG